jgi:hypothetical protein
VCKEDLEDGVTTGIALRCQVCDEALEGEVMGGDCLENRLPELRDTAEGRLAQDRPRDAVPA